MLSKRKLRCVNKSADVFPRTRQVAKQLLEFAKAKQDAESKKVRPASPRGIAPVVERAFASPTVLQTRVLLRDVRRGKGLRL